ncbi:hypothetical protein P7F88_02305 [Vibrio hannami]|uniref:hypothetical protein n=1 Tax=Vibrio hannami TaxID=2717094 RepID=UPI00240FF7C6|nr:hypothetical protein [Vibrio hannami]MDG3084983.1 hypothetical protein [Vibrio hannami]
MKTLTKILAAATSLAISVSVFAHMGGGKGGPGFMHAMMNTESPQYQAMLELRKDPEAMRAWMQSMHDDPEAMREWMSQMHGDDFANQKRGFGCRGNRFNNGQEPVSE